VSGTTPKAPPDQGKLLVMAYGYMHAWLTEDYATAARIEVTLEDCGATMVQVAQVFSLAAAALATAACDGSAVQAARLAEARYLETAGRQARNPAALLRMCAQPHSRPVPPSTRGIAPWR